MLGIPSFSRTSRLAVGSLRGLEAGAHRKGENRKRAEAQSDLSKHLVSPLQRVRDYLGLYRAPAASANVASAAAVNSKCFQPFNFARITPPP